MGVDAARTWAQPSGKPVGVVVVVDDAAAWAGQGRARCGPAPVRPWAG